VISPLWIKSHCPSVPVREMRTLGSHPAVQQSQHRVTSGAKPDERRLARDDDMGELKTVGALDARLSAGHQFDRIADLDAAGASHRSVETQASAEAADDVA
jgi:hypothetical protein